jgi:hypothetical protein
MLRKRPRNISFLSKRYEDDRIVASAGRRFIMSVSAANSSSPSGYALFGCTKFTLEGRTSGTSEMKPAPRRT